MISLKNGYFIRILLSLSALVFFSCSKDPASSDHEKDPLSILPTITQGPGGPAYMQGKLRDYLKPDQPATNTHLYLMNQLDYTDTLLHLFVNSRDGSFLITELPVDTIDLIIVGTTFLSVKINSFILRNDLNSFHNIGPEGLWIDSTLFMVAVADSVPRPDMPQLGVLGYGKALVVHFNPGVEEGEALAVLEEFPYDTLRVFPDSIYGDGYAVIYPQNTNSLMFQRLRYFNWHRLVREAGPGIAVVQPLNWRSLSARGEEVELTRHQKQVGIFMTQKLKE